MAGSVTGRDEAKAVYDRLLASAAALYARNVDHYRRLLDGDDVDRDARPAARRVVRLGEGRHRQGHGHQPDARHRAPGRLPHLGGQRAPRLRLVLRSRRALDGARPRLLRRLRRRPHGPRVPEEVPASGRQGPPRDLAERGPHPVVHGLPVPLEQRRRDAALRDRPGRPLAGHGRPGVPRRELGLDRQGLALHGRDRHGRQRPRREHEVRPRLGGRRRPLSGPRGDLPARRSGSRPVAAWPSWPRSRERRDWPRKRGTRASARGPPSRRPTGSRATASTASPPCSRARRRGRPTAVPSASGGRRGSTPWRRARLVDEDTVLPAVPLWWEQLDEARAQSEIDHLGSGALATDWGARLLSDRSALYDPLSYHHGSVWPLFTGWASMAAYRYGRPHVGYQALMANALLRSRERPRLRDRAPVRRLPVGLRPLVAPPDLVRGHGRHPDRARALRPRAGRGRPGASLRAAASRGLGPRRRAQRGGGRQRSTT